MTQEEKLTKILEGQIRLEERQKAIGEYIISIDAKLEAVRTEGCQVGAVHASKIKGIERETTDQWKRINELAKPTRTAAITAGGVGAGMGALMVALREFGPMLMRAMNGG